MASASFEAVTGRLGVGAIAFFGLFLIADGLMGILPLMESIGQSTTWGNIGILPTIVVSYFVGVICLELADIAFSGSSRFSTPRPEDAIAVSATGSVLLCQMYSDQLQNHALLKGSSVSFVVLAVGCLAESRSMGGFTSSVWLFALSGVLLATLSLLFSARAGKHAVTIAIAARAELLTPSNTQKNPAGAELAQCGKV